VASASSQYEAFFTCWGYWTEINTEQENMWEYFDILVMKTLVLEALPAGGADSLGMSSRSVISRLTLLSYQIMVLFKKKSLVSLSSTFHFTQVIFMLLQLSNCLTKKIQKITHRSLLFT
jgi:hypothetical protein